jgi:hypothetical protein
MRTSLRVLKDAKQGVTIATICSSVTNGLRRPGRPAIDRMEDGRALADDPSMRRIREKRFVSRSRKQLLLEVSNLTHRQSCAAPGHRQRPSRAVRR